MEKPVRGNKKKNKTASVVINIEAATNSGKVIFNLSPSIVAANCTAWNYLLVLYSVGVDANTGISLITISTSLPSED